MPSPTPSLENTLRLEDQICFALYAATNALVRTYRPLLASLGLTYPQYLVMLVLWQHGSAPMHAIADRLQLGANSITPLVERLERAGLVERGQGAADRRVVMVALTEAGAALHPGAALTQDTVVCRTGLGDADLARLRGELHRLVDRLGPGEPDPLPAGDDGLPGRRAAMA